MKNRTILLFLAFFFICQIGISQIDPEVLTKNGNKYYYQTRFYSKSELGPVLESNAESFKIYTKYLKERKAHKRLVGLSIAAVIIWYKWQEDLVDSDLNLGKRIISIPIVSILPIASIVSTVKISGKNKKAVRIFNEDLKQVPKIGYQPTLDFSSTNNGIGLVFNF